MPGPLMNTVPLVLRYGSRSLSKANYNYLGLGSVVTKAFTSKPKPLFIRLLHNNTLKDQVTTKASKTTEEIKKKLMNKKPIKPIHMPPKMPITKEYIYTIPNILTATRLFTAPAIGYLLCTHQPKSAMVLFVYSCITDWVDGYVARKYNMGSVLGSIIDPMADKLLMTICTISLWYNMSMPSIIASIIIGRDVMLGLMAIYYRYISLPAPKTFKRYWDFSIPSAEVHPTRLSKWNTGFQMLYIGALVLKPGVESLLGADYIMFEQFLTGFEYLVATTTILSGASYLFSKKAVKFL